MTVASLAPIKIERPFGFRFVAPLALGSALNPINSSLIATAMVPIADAFHATAADTSWLISGLYCASAVAQPVMGRLADIFGPRRVFVTALALVAIAGVVGALATSLGVLIFTRVLIGIGTSGAYPAAMRMFRNRGDEIGGPPPRTAMGVLSLSSLAVTAVGPLLGGVLTAAFGWHTVFAVNLPLALIAMAFVLLWAPRDKPATGRPDTIWQQVDIVGIVLFSGLLLSLMLVLMTLSHPNWLWLALGILSCATLIVWSRRRPQPFIDVRMLAQNRPLTFTYLRIAAILVINYCMFYGLAQWLESAGGYSTSAAGLITMPMSVVAAAASFLAARIRSIRLAFLIATAAAFVASIALLLLNHDSPFWLIAGAVALFGLPLGMTSTATQAVIYVQSPPDKIGVAAGLQRTAGYLGSIASAGLLANMFGTRADDPGFHTLVLVLAVLSAILVFAVLVDPTIPKPAKT